MSRAGFGCLRIGVLLFIIDFSSRVLVSNTLLPTCLQPVLGHSLKVGQRTPWLAARLQNCNILLILALSEAVYIEAEILS